MSLRDETPFGAFRPHGETREVPLPNGQVRIDHVDAEGRLLHQEMPDGTVRRYSYDGEGHLAGVYGNESVSFAHGERRMAARTEETETLVEWDEAGRPVSLTQTIDGLSWTYRVTRDGEGQEVGWHYPGARAPLEVVESSPGARRLVCGLRDYLTLSHEPDTGRTRMELANGVVSEEVLEHGRTPRLVQLSVAGDRRIAWEYGHSEAGKIVQAGEECFAYDDAGRLIEARTPERHWRYRHDARGRLVGIDGDVVSTMTRGAAPMAEAVDVGGRRTDFTYDAQGRRKTARGSEGETGYRYNTFGQLEGVTLPDGREITYLYDGFGRLVGRRAPEGTIYYMLDLENRRIAEMDGSGRVTRAYLWMGAVCIGALNGPPGQRLAESYHRAHAERMIRGDAAGRLSEAFGEAFGSDIAIPAQGPGYAGLFGDPETGLLNAGARWLDPRIAEFTTPDSWFGDMPDRAAAGRLRRALRTMPGGTDRFLSPDTAYQWCALDPVNALDLNGHNWLGLIFTTISAFLWQMQLTSVALQMEVLNIIIEVVLALVGVFGAIGGSGWADEGFRDWYWRWSIFNLAPPAASYRLMVPFSLWLNGVMKIQPERAWTLGSIVWERGSDFRETGELAKRDLVILPDTAGLHVAQTVAHRDGALMVANDATAVTGAYGSAASPVVTAAGGAAVDTGLIYNAEPVAVRLPGREDHSSRLSANPAGATPNLNLNLAPPSELDGQNVEVRRLDTAWLRIEAEARTIARPVVFLSGTVLHIGRQIPEGFPTSGLTIREYLPALERVTQGGVGFPAENIRVRAESGASVAAFAVGNPIKLTNTTTSVGRRVTALQGARDMLVDPALDGVAGPVDVVRLQTSGTPAPNQSEGTLPGTANRRITAGRLTNIRVGDGVEIQGTGTVQREVRIVGQLLLDVTLPAVPAAVRGVDIVVDQMLPDATTGTAAEVGGGGLTLETGPGNTDGFAAGQAVSLRGGGDAVGVIASVDAAANTVTLTEASGIADGTNVTLRRLTANRQIEAEQVQGGGTQLILHPSNPASLNSGDILRLRPSGDADGGAVRRLTADPGVAVEITEDLVGATRANLTVTRLVEDNSAGLTAASLSAVRIRLDYGAPPPVAAADTVLVDDGTEQTIAEIDSVSGNIAILAAAQDFPDATPVTVTRLTATGGTKADVSLDEGLVMIPSDMGEDPTTRQRALQNHEMRHVFQEALWGPFFISMPIPWLFHLGFSIDDATADRRSKVMRHISLGGLDSFIAWVVWGIGGKPGAHSITGTIQPDRHLVQFPESVDADTLAKFESGSRIDIEREDFEDLNAVDALDTGARTLRLRFEPNATRFPTGSEITLEKSEFEQVRKTINTWFSLNLEQLWAEHIPTAWGRALSSLLNRDSWLPGIGLYLLGFYITSAQNTDDSRSPFEQDAAFHSGDLYTDIPLSEPTNVFVGQFSRIVGFVQARRGGISRFGNPATLLSVRLPAGGNITDVMGGVDNGLDGTTQRVRLHQNWLLNFHPRVENVVGGLFAASASGTYLLEMPNQLRDDTGALPDDVVLAHAMPTAFTERDRVIVRALVAEPATSRTIFETERVSYVLQERDSTASYALRFPDGGTTHGQLDAMSYTAPLHATATSEVVEIAATYPAAHAVFTGPGQEGDADLTAAQRTNLAERFTLTIEEITLPAVGPVVAGASTTFEVPIAPRAADVTSPRPAGASADARVSIGAGRPAELTFFAPDAVDAAGDVEVTLRFGLDAAGFPSAARRDLILRVNVTPA